MAAGIVTLIAVLAAEWYRWFLDRPVVNVRAHLGFVLTPGSVDETRQVFLEALNPHSKPVTLSSCGFAFRYAEWGNLWVSPVPGYSFPYQVDGGKALTQWIPVQTLLKTVLSEGRTPSDIKWVWFQASSGKQYRSKVAHSVLRALEDQSRGTPAA